MPNQASGLNSTNDERFNFDNDQSKPSGTNTDNISRAEESFADDQSSEWVPKTEEEVEDHIDFVIGDIQR